tara:strand:- start:427 stop:669 length:243 start_codon:yes stop_codon:yes gene_type:complete
MIKNELMTIELLNELLKETIKLNNEINRIRTKLDSQLFRIATKYNVIDNKILVCKNKFRNSVKCYNVPTPKTIENIIEFN